MRLTELKEKVRNTRIPKAIFHELWVGEVDTIDANSPSAKQMLGDEMGRGVPAGNVFKVPLSKESKEYLLFKALPNQIDIARDNMNKRLVNSLRKFQARLHAKLVGVEK